MSRKSVGHYSQSETKTPATGPGVRIELTERFGASLLGPKEYERQLKELQEAYGEAMLELRARKKLQSLLGEDEK